MNNIKRIYSLLITIILALSITSLASASPVQIDLTNSTTSNENSELVPFVSTVENPNYDLNTPHPSGNDGGITCDTPVASISTFSI